MTKEEIKELKDYLKENLYVKVSAWEESTDWGTTQIRTQVTVWLEDEQIFFGID